MSPAQINSPLQRQRSEFQPGEPDQHAALRHMRNHAAEAQLHDARRRLVALRASERSERHWLQSAGAQLDALEAGQGRATKTQAELRLELETHKANVETIEQHIESLRQWIEETHRLADEPGRAVMRMIEAKAAAQKPCH
jgi:fido (protein-threonine AMPylation protein)